MAELEKRVAQADTGRAVHEADLARWIVIAVGLGALALGLWLAWVISRFHRPSPLAQAVVVAQQVAQGAMTSCAPLLVRLGLAPWATCCATTTACASGRVMEREMTQAGHRPSARAPSPTAITIQRARSASCTARPGIGLGDALFQLGHGGAVLRDAVGLPPG